MEQPYKRILLKLSGEQLAGKFESGIDAELCKWLAQEIKKVSDDGTQVVVMVGGGNFARGAQLAGNGIKRVTGDHIGMLATMMNSMALNDILESKGQTCRILLKLEANKISEGFTRLRAIEHMKKGRVVIVAGGTGNPFVTTDTASVSVALELGCDAVVKVTKVDGVYDKDPKKHTDAKKYTNLTYSEVFANENIKVMDRAAMSMAHSNNMKIMVCELKPGMITNVLSDSFDGTVIR